MTGQSQQPQEQQGERVAQLHREAAEDYGSGAEARAGLDRAEALRREMWG